MTDDGTALRGRAHRPFPDDELLVRPGRFVARADPQPDRRGADGRTRQRRAQDPYVVRDYAEAHGSRDPAELTDLLAENLADYRAHVHRCQPADLPAESPRLLTEHGSRSAVVPPGCRRCGCRP